MDHRAKAIFESRLRPETEFIKSASRVQLAPQLAVGFGRVPSNVPAKTRNIRDQRDEVFDADFISASKVYRDALFEGFRGLDDPFGRVVNIKEFAGWRTVSPNDYLFLTSSFSFDAFPNERRDDMRALRIEIVSRAVEVYRHKKYRI